MPAQPPVRGDPRQAAGTPTAAIHARKPLAQQAATRTVHNRHRTPPRKHQASGLRPSPQAEHRRNGLLARPDTRPVQACPQRPASRDYARGRTWRPPAPERKRKRKREPGRHAPATIQPGTRGRRTAAEEAGTGQATPGSQPTPRGQGPPSGRRRRREPDERAQHPPGQRGRPQTGGRRDADRARQAHLDRRPAQPPGAAGGKTSGTGQATPGAHPAGRTASASAPPPRRDPHQEHRWPRTPAATSATPARTKGAR